MTTLNGRLPVTVRFGRSWTRQAPIPKPPLKSGPPAQGKVRPFHPILKPLGFDISACPSWAKPGAAVVGSLGCALTRLGQDERDCANPKNLYPLNERRPYTQSSPCRPGGG